MKFWILLLFAALVRSEEGQEEVTKPLPYKNPVILKRESVLFWETFQSGKSGSSPSDFGWILSTEEEYVNQDPKIKSTDAAFEGDQSLVLNKKHVRYGLSKKLEKPISLDSEELIIQFETRFHSKLTCSGAYLKFVAESEDSTDQKKFSEKTPYVLMFGPDKCGNNEKIHAIFRHQNPITKEFEEKHMLDISKPSNDKHTHVYTLHLSKKDQMVKVSMDLEEKGIKSALEDKSFKPSFLAPKEIDDPEDKKPEDWIDLAKIPDPEAKKPDDWVDQKMIVDETSTKPDDWDDEEDGTWEPPMIENPAYKGEWRAPLIENPGYKGVWKPRKIPNPNHFEQEFPLSTLPKITHVFLEVLSNDDDITFDNILITTDVDTARNIAEFHSLEKQKHERKIASERDAKESEGISAQFKSFTDKVYTLYEENPMPVAGFVGTAGIFLYYFLFRRKRSTTPVAPVPKKKSEDEKKNEDGDEDSAEKESDKEEEDSDVVEITNEKPAKKGSARRRPTLAF